MCTQCTCYYWERIISFTSQLSLFKFMDMFERNNTHSPRSGKINFTLTSSRQYNNVVGKILWGDLFPTASFVFLLCILTLSLRSFNLVRIFCLTLSFCLLLSLSHYHWFMMSFDMSALRCVICVVWFSLKPKITGRPTKITVLRYEQNVFCICLLSEKKCSNKKNISAYEYKQKRMMRRKKKKLHEQHLQIDKIIWQHIARTFQSRRQWPYLFLFLLKCISFERTITRARSHTTHSRMRTEKSGKKCQIRRNIEKKNSHASSVIKSNFKEYSSGKI